MKKNLLKKKKDHAFGKDVYLLGEDSDGIKYWLEAPKWNCGWYWGFGYVETYTINNSPGDSKDIKSHQHIDSSFLGKQVKYDHEKGGFVLGEYVHNLYDAFHKTVFSKDEGWELSELFRQFYLLSKMAEFSHKDKPGCHITTSPVDHGDLKDWYEKINKEMIPRITEKILSILEPNEVDEKKFSDGI